MSKPEPLSILDQTILMAIDPPGTEIAVNAMQIAERAYRETGAPSVMILLWGLAKIIRSVAELHEVPVSAIMERLQLGIDSQGELNDAGHAERVPVDVSGEVS